MLPHSPPVHVGWACFVQFSKVKTICNGEVICQKDGEIVLPFGLRDGQLVSVNDVERGKHKDVVCPACQIPLVARKGSVRSHYFAHSNGSDCPTALQTVLHRRAKDIIKEQRQMFLPEHSIFVSGLQKSFLITKPQMIDVKYVELEQRLGGIIPDVIVTTDKGVEVLVEIKVSHAVELQLRGL